MALLSFRPAHSSVFQEFQRAGVHGLAAVRDGELGNMHATDDGHYFKPLENQAGGTPTHVLQRATLDIVSLRKTGTIDKAELNNLLDEVRQIARLVAAAQEAQRLQGELERGTTLAQSPEEAVLGLAAEAASTRESLDREVSARLDSIREDIATLKTREIVREGRQVIANLKRVVDDGHGRSAS